MVDGVYFRCCRRRLTRQAVTDRGRSIYFQSESYLLDAGSRETHLSGDALGLEGGGQLAARVECGVGGRAKQQQQGADGQDGDDGELAGGVHRGGDAPMRWIAAECG